MALTCVWIFLNVEYDMMVLPFIDEVQGAGDLYNPKRYCMHNLYPLKAMQDVGARLMGHDNELGSIKVGRIEDLIVLDRNVVKLAENGQAEQIADTRVDLTWFEGRLVYEPDPNQPREMN